MKKRGDGISQEDLLPFAAIGTGISLVTRSIVESQDDRLLAIIEMKDSAVWLNGEKRSDEMGRAAFGGIG